MLRPYFLRHRFLLKDLCRLAQESLTDYLRVALACPKGVPGIILTLHTFGEYLDFHPHVHALVADGLFVTPADNSPDRQQRVDFQLSTLNFLSFSEAPLQPLVEQKLLPPERVQILYSWKHSGFNVHVGQPAPPESRADLEDLSQYILRNPFSVEKMTLESPGAGERNIAVEGAVH